MFCPHDGRPPTYTGTYADEGYGRRDAPHLKKSPNLHPPQFSGTFPDPGPWVGLKPIRSGSHSLMVLPLLKLFQRHW